jgi:hypothetical protein
MWLIKGETMEHNLLKIPTRLVVRYPCAPIIQQESTQPVFITKLPLRGKRRSPIIDKNTNAVKLLWFE